MGQAEQATKRRNANAEQELWDLRVKKADWLYKVLISIVGSLLAAAFFVYQYRQTESREFTELQSAREDADSKLRAEMFKTLFEAYFASKVKATKEGSESSDDILKALRQEVLLSDVLARNFENIDIRPVFEDLDQRLANQIYAEARSALPPTPEQLRAFRQRQQLRRVALGATSRQTASLEALEGEAHASVTIHQVHKSCEYGTVSFEPPLPEAIAKASVSVEVDDLQDGNLLMNIRRNVDLAQTRPIDVSFFDMPALENLPLESGERLAFSLTSYLSRGDCERFKEALDPVALSYCPDLTSDNNGFCAIGTFRTVILPKKFLGLRDRPYQTDLAAGRYREPWYKFR
jgi:hypothetical protein